MPLIYYAYSIITGSAGAHYNMTCVYAKQNKKEEAVGSLKQAMDKGFKDRSIIAKDLDLKNIRGTEYYANMMNSYKGSH